MQMVTNFVQIANTFAETFKNVFSYTIYDDCSENTDGRINLWKHVTLTYEDFGVFVLLLLSFFRVPFIGKY